MDKIQVGDRITIYQKPVTQEDKEGRATLIRPLGKPSQDNLQLWEVQFVGEDEIYQRLVSIYV